MDRLSPVSRNQKCVVETMPYFMGVLVLLFSSLLLVIPAWSGGSGHHGPNPEKQLKKLTKRLGLTGEQQAKVKPILEEKAQQLQALHQQMKEVRQHTRSQIEAELTPEQVQAYKELREKRKEHKGKHGKRYNGKHKNDEHGEHDDDKDD